MGLAGLLRVELEGAPGRRQAAAFRAERDPQPRQSAAVHHPEARGEGWGK